MTDFRALCAELIDWLDSGTAACRIRVSPAAMRARAALAEGEAGPSDEELLELAEQYRSDGLIDLYSARDFARAVLARYGSAPRPIPLAERLPGAEDCDAEGRCWWCDSIQWRWDFLIADNRKPSAYDHWLPAHAITTPENTDA